MRESEWESEWELSYSRDRTLRLSGKTCTDARSFVRKVPKDVQRCLKIFAALTKELDLLLHTVAFTDLSLYIFIYLYKSYFIIFYPGHKSFVRLFSCVHLTFLWLKALDCISVEVAQRGLAMWSRALLPLAAVPVSIALQRKKALAQNYSRNGEEKGNWNRNRNEKADKFKNKTKKIEIAVLASQCVCTVHMKYQGLQAP